VTNKLEMFAAQASVSPVYASNGNSPWAQRYAQELREVVLRYAARLPRNVQRHLGPSELGHRCDRSLVGKMAGVSFSHGGNQLHDSWPSIVGTALHAFLEEAFRWDALQPGANLGRWFTETRVTPDPGAVSSHPGTADLFDTVFSVLGDHKGVALDTRIPTPAGWTTMGALTAGDQVLGADGRPCSVTRVYPVQYRDCYRVVFKGGASVVTDDVQLWEVSRNRNGGCSTRSQETVLLSSAEMREQLKSKSGQRHLRVRTVPVDLPAARLPVHPYVLGMWLGDGECHGGQVGFGGEDAAELSGYIRDCGYELSTLLNKADGFRKYTVLGLLPQLEDAGVIIRGEGYLGKKIIIPAVYLRASREQRLELLRGLMDTAGSHLRSQSVYTTARKELAFQVEELASSLGWKAYMRLFQLDTGFGVTTTAYRVMFTPAGDNPFWLSRKACLVRQAAPVSSLYRLVQSVEPVPSVATRCIDVDSPGRLYLVTGQFIPTHNCQSEAIRTRLRRHGLPYHYYIQMLLYALGYMHLGYNVQRIVLISWPRTKSSLDDMYVHEQMITQADISEVMSVLEKTVLREQLAKFVAVGGMSFWDIPPTPSESDCQYCPYFNPAALQDGTSKGCPGTSLKKF
jgi:hypothetical protein